jgi:hypothetical protein
VQPVAQHEARHEAGDEEDGEDRPCGEEDAAEAVRVERGHDG